MIRAALQRLPPWALVPLRQAVRQARPALAWLGMTRSNAVRDGRDPFGCLGSRDMRAMWRLMCRNPYMVLQIREVRQFIARERIEALMSRAEVRRVEKSTTHVIHNALNYNLDGARTAPDLDRPAIMVNILSSIEKIRNDIGTRDVLSIGPRSEIEIFALMAAGFDPIRIKALDLFSYSPYVDIGDMHDMPYSNGSFDVVLLGWVIAYSKDQKRVAEEVLRVCRDRAVVVVAGDYSDESRRLAEFNYENTFVKSCDQLLALFSGNVGQVYFRHDPAPPRTAMVMTVFEVHKP